MIVDDDGYQPPDPLPGLDEVSAGERPVREDMSIVIPTLGRPILEKALTSMVSGRSWPARIIVVDQGKDGAVPAMLAKVEAIGVRTLRVAAEPRGRAPALNLGLRAVDTTYVAITDDDCVVAPDWLDTLRDRLVAHPDTIVSGRIEDVGDEESVAHALSRTEERRTTPSLVYDVMSGGNAGMPHSVFERVGPFDEDPRVALAEDTEYAYRALRAGVQLLYAPEVRIWHYAWRDVTARARQYRGYARSHGSYYGKYIRRGDLFMVGKASFHMLRAVRRWVRSTLKGDENMAAHARAYSLHLIPGIVTGMRSPKRENRT